MIWLLPSGLVLAVIIALVSPTPGAWLNQMGMMPWIISAIFFINGFQTTASDAKVGKGFGSTLALSGLINLAIAPLIGWFAFSILPLSTELLLGLAVMSAVPPTLSSCVVLTRLVKGNAQWSFWFTLALNLLGIVVMPISLTFIVGSEVDIHSWQLFLKLCITVLLPFLLGMAVRAIVRPTHIPTKLGIVPTLLVIIGAWITLSDSSEQLYLLSYVELIWILTISALVHLMLLALSHFSATLAHLEYGARMAVLFTASQKTMPIAVSVVVSINASFGVAIITCVIFHTLQMLMDSLLAALISRHRVPA